MAEIAIRRYQSAVQRGVNPNDAKGCKADLTKGLISHFETNPKLIGPLRRDYEYVAERIEQILREANNGKKTATKANFIRSVPCLIARLK